MCIRDSIREAVGNRADILFGTHGQFTVSGAKRMARRLEKYDPLWFEEPTSLENPADMAEIARFTSIPIATGERLCTKHEFARVLEAGAASILQLDLGRVGGLLEACLLYTSQTTCAKRGPRWRMSCSAQSPCP